MKKKQNNRGVTMVEVIVAFALSAIFMAAATALISPYTKIYLRLNAMNRVEDEVRIVSETIVNELTYATGYDTGGLYILEDPDLEGFSQIKYSDKNGNPATLRADQEKGLIIDYEGIKYPNSEDYLYEPTTWYYGKGFYKKNEVKEIKFEKWADNDNKIKYTLTVESPYYSRTVTGYLECLDLTADKITAQAEAGG